MTIASYTTMRDLLAADFKAAFPMPTQWENGPFNVPQNAPLWAKFNVLAGQEECVAIGYPLNRYRFGGVLKIVVFFPLLQGAGVASLKADQIADRYRGSVETIAGVVFMGVLQNEARQDEAMPDWWKIVVDCTFRADLYR